MSRKQTHAFSEPERERRRRNVRATTGNQALAGLHPDEDDLAEFDATPITIHDLDPDACGISVETGAFMWSNAD